MIEFESVSKTFRDGTAAVVDLSLTVPSDKITVIVGPSGCGKTTTLRMVNRMIEPTKGRVLWDGAPIRTKRKTALRRQMGYVIQSGGLFPHRTVRDNVGTVPGLLGWSRSKTDKRALELLDSVGLDRSLADRYPAQLSGGQQQRVGVARALAADPLVLLMDEPFSAVDPVVRQDLHEFFLDLQRRLSKTIILITHDIDEAIKLGDQVAILRVGGRLAQVGTPQDLLEHPADAFVEGFVGRDRGYRSLSFLSADVLSLEAVKVVRDVSSAGAGGPTLVVDADARPTGWADPAHPGQVLPLGATFDVENGTLRSALDSALTSPFGLAVGVTAKGGRYAGVAAAEAILTHVGQARQVSRPSVELAGSAAAPAADDDDPGIDILGFGSETESRSGAHALGSAPDAHDRRGAGQAGQVGQAESDPDGAAVTAVEAQRPAELGEESGRDVSADVPAAAGSVDLLHHESELSAAEDATTPSSSAESRR